MCRFLLYLGRPVLISELITEPANSLIHQSIDSKEREEPLNGDGFGLGWYVPHLSDEPAIFRSISPAWSNQNLEHLARMTMAHCVLAHVRAASQGLSVAEANCHPFTFGPHAFMHNGSLARFARHKRRLLTLLSDQSFALIEGSTDSEFLFAYFLDRWAQLAHVVDAAERMAQALEQTIVQLVAEVTPDHHDKGEGEHSYLNLAVCDGQTAVASRFTTDEPRFAESLHLRAGAGHAHGVRPSVLISSEALADDGSWSTVPVNQLLIVRHNGEVVQRLVGA